MSETLEQMLAGVNCKRSITFNQAKVKYVHRFTMEHVPAWALKPMCNGKHYAPQYRTDKEWYDRTFFKGENEVATDRFCYSTYPTWPLGKSLDKPYRRGRCQ